jgi:hypothetical protein
MSTTSKHGHAARSPILHSGLLWAGNAASSAGTAYPGASPEAQNNKRSDFIHSEPQKMAITPLASINLPQNPRRFLSIFIRETPPFSAQNHPLSPSCIDRLVPCSLGLLVPWSLPFCSLVPLVPWSLPGPRRQVFVAGVAWSLLLPTPPCPFVKLCKRQENAVKGGPNRSK